MKPLINIPIKKIQLTRWDLINLIKKLETNIEFTRKMKLKAGNKA